MGKKNKNGIPERWTDYTAVGKRIPGTRFIAFKVPLKKSFDHLTRSEAFRPSDLVHLVKKEKEDLGLIIDLTFTTRYYSVQDLPNSVLYLKIFTKGQEVPSNSTILSFKKAVRHFLRENQHNDKLIGVHCTHGLNRTGYLICRYLIDVDGMKHTKAIQLFNSSRGHSIERENYLEDLREGPHRSNKGMDKPEQDPVRGCAPEMLHPPHEHSNPTHHMPPVNAWAPHWHHVHPPQNFSHHHQRTCEPWFRPSPSFTLPPPPGGRRARGRFRPQNFRGSQPPLSGAFPQYRWGGPLQNPDSGLDGGEGFSRSKWTHRHRRGAHRGKPY